MATTTRLNLPLMVEAEAQKHIQHNEAMMLAEALLAPVINHTLTAPPVSPAEGDSYAVASPATGAWLGQEGALAYLSNGGWAFIPGIEGLTLPSAVDGIAFIQFKAGAWGIADTGGAVVGLSPILNHTLADPPLAPAEGDSYVIASPATGAWLGQEDALAKFTFGAWEFTAPFEGLSAASALASVAFLQYTGGAWGVVNTGGGGAGLSPIIDHTLPAPPAVPAEGDSYIVAPPATGDWLGQENALAVFKLGAWEFTAPVDGLVVASADVDILLLQYVAVVWMAVPPIPSLAGNASLVLAVNAAGTGIEWVDPALIVLVDVAAANKDLFGADMGNRIIQMDFATANTVTIQVVQGSDALPGQSVTVRQKGVGLTTIVPGAFVTVESAGDAVDFRAQFSVATLVYLGSQKWALFGDVV